MFFTLRDIFKKLRNFVAGFEHHLDYLCSLQSRRRLTLQEVCNDKLEILCERFFLEKAWANDDDSYFKMHDLMHDLSTKVGGEEMVVVDLNSTVDPNKLVLKENVRHLTLDHRHLEYDETSTFEPIGRRLRTFLQVNSTTKEILNVDKLVTACPLLRVLDLQDSGIIKLTDSIGKLIHLRYLDISLNQFQILPDSVTELINLKYLNLTGCGGLICLPSRMDALTSLEELNLLWCNGLEKLPTGIVKLANLKYLNIKKCFDLIEMPSGISALMPFCSSSRFIIGHPDSKRSAQLEELRLLPELKEGTLTIEVPRSIALKGRGDGEAYLVNKKWLKELRIWWKYMGEEDMEVKYENHIDILAKLQPPPNLKMFRLNGYQSMTFPLWVPKGGFASVLPNLVTMHLFDCGKCLHLPPLSRLPCLRSLGLWSLRSLEYIEEENIASIASFCPCLEELELEKLPELKGWCRGLDDRGREQSLMLPSFPQLNSLCISECSNLRVSPILFSFVKLFESSQTSSVSLFDEVCRNNGSFRLSFKKEIDKDYLSLTISKFNSTENTSIYMDEAVRGLIDCLSHLTIFDCSGLKTLPRGMQHLTALQKLVIYNCSDFTWEDNDKQSLEHQQTCSDDEMSRTPFKSLRVLTLRGLPKMVRLPKWIQSASSLINLTLVRLPRMKTPPEWIHQLLTNLKQLEISDDTCLTFPECLHNNFVEERTYMETTIFKNKKTLCATSS